MNSDLEATPMTGESLEPEDRERIANLASRAGKLISRRSVVALTGRRLALPIQATYVVSKTAMAMSGSGAGDDDDGRLGDDDDDG